MSKEELLNMVGAMTFGAITGFVFSMIVTVVTDDDSNTALIELFTPQLCLFVLGGMVLAGAAWHYTTRNRH